MAGAAGNALRAAPQGGAGAFGAVPPGAAVGSPPPQGGLLGQMGQGMTSMSPQSGGYIPSSVTPYASTTQGGQAGVSTGAQAQGIGGLPVNPMQQASIAQQGALAGTAASGMTDIGTIAGSNIAQYQNPYTQQVIDASAQDVLRNAQIGLNALGSQASAAGAFGGSRHGIAMGELGRGVAQQLAQQSAGLRQAGFQQAQTAAQQDIQNRLSQANLGLSAAGQLGALGQQSFGYGQQIQQNLAQQGAQQQAIQQALIDAAKAQYAGYTGAPAAGLGYVSQALGATPVPQTQTTSRQPGLFDYLTLAATAASGSNFGN